MIKYSIKKYWKLLIPMIVLTFLQALSNLKLPEYMSDIVSFGIVKLDLNYIKKVGLLMLAVSLIGTVFAIISNYFSAVFSAKFTKHLRKESFSKIMQMDTELINKFDSSSLITRSTNDINQVEMFCSIFFKMISFTIFMGIGGTIKAIQKSNGMNSLTIIMLITLSVIFILLLLVFKVVVPKFNLLQKLIDKINKKTRENLNGVLVIRSLNKQSYEEKSYDNINDEFSKTNLFINKAMALLDPALLFIMNATSIAIIWIVAKEATNTIQVGNMIAFIQYASDILMSFLFISIIFVLMPRALVSFNRIKEVIDSKNTIIDSKKKFNIDGNISFKNISFKYPGSEEYTLKNIDFDINKGESIAIIGGTGSGKSSLVTLLPRLFDVTEGEILIDGINIKDIDITTLRDNISFMTQKAILFSGTIESNIKDGKKKLTKEDIINASKNSESISFINKKKNKFKSDIAQNATNISGGQKQRLSIARGLVRNAPIMIFDDTFSALDYETEASLRNNLKKHYSKNTIIVIAQRIGSIMNADKIIVLDKGKIVGIGKHKDLLKECKIYKEIALSQLSKEEI